MNTIEIIPEKTIENYVDFSRLDARNKAMNPNNNYDSFSMMSDLTNLVKTAIKQTYVSEKQKLFGDKPLDDFAIFVFGSPARGEMTCYSDIDLHVINESKDVRAKILKQKIVSSLEVLGFSKIDDPNWEHLSVAEEYVKKSITEGNQIIDSIYVCGDKKIASQLDKLKRKYDTLDRNIRNIFFQKFYLEHYYSNRSTNELPNVKYSPGGSREILTFDWFDKIMSFYERSWFKGNTNNNVPLVKKAIDNLFNAKLVSAEQYLQIYEAVDFITLLRNEILHINKNTSEKGITHLDDLTKIRLWNLSDDYFIYLGAKSSTDILKLFEKYSGIIKDAKEFMWQKTLDEEAKRRPVNWLMNLEKILDLNISSEELVELSKLDDNLLNIASVWSAHYKQDKTLFEKISRKYLNKNNWEVIASLACSPLCPPDILHEIGTKHARQIGSEYILRILGRNPSVNTETLKSIVNDHSIDKHYKIVAKLHLEKGVEYAIKRAS